MTDTAVTINKELIVTLVMIHRIACRAMSDDERVGQRILGNPRGEINGLLVQMSAIEQLARAGLPKEGLELLDLAVAKEETPAIRAEGREAIDFLPGLAIGGINEIILVEVPPDPEMRALCRAMIIDEGGSTWMLMPRQP